MNRRLISFVPEGRSSRVRWLSIGALALLVTAGAIFELEREPVVGQTVANGGESGLGLPASPREPTPLATLLCDPLDEQPDALIGGSFGSCAALPPDCGANALLCGRGREKTEERFEATVSEELGLDSGERERDHERTERRAEGSGAKSRGARKKATSASMSAEPPPASPGPLENTLAVLKALAATRPITAPRREYLDLTPVSVPRKEPLAAMSQTIATDYKAKKKLIESAVELPAPVTDALASGGVPVYRPANTQGDVAIVVSPSWPVGLSVKGTFH